MSRTYRTPHRSAGYVQIPRPYKGQDGTLKAPRRVSDKDVFSGPKPNHSRGHRVVNVKDLGDSRTNASHTFCLCCGPDRKERLHRQTRRAGRDIVRRAMYELAGASSLLRRELP